MRVICGDQTDYVWPAVLDIINIMNMQYYQRYCQLYQTLKTIQLGCPVSSKIRWRDKTTTVSFLVECWDWELFKDKCLIFPVAARPVRREYSVASLGNPNHLVYDLYLFTSDLWYRNDKSKNFQNQILNWLLGKKVFSHKLTLDLLLVQSTHSQLLECSMFFL